MIVSRQIIAAPANQKDSSLPTLAYLPSFVLHGRNRSYYWQGIGALSIKTFWKGRAFYDVGDGRFAVDETSYLILNHAQPYSITIEANQPVESFCLFFAADLAADVLRNRRLSSERLLDEPHSAEIAPARFYDRTYPHDDVLSPALFALQRTVAQGGYEATWLEEQFHRMLERLNQTQERVHREIETVPAARYATREELYRRLHRARDYALASLHRPVTLEEMARAACLSPNHLLRTFKQVFHQTPHQYLTAQRLEWAKRLLRQSQSSVTGICFEVGFESLGSFSSLFRRHVGVSPEGYRRQK